MTVSLARSSGDVPRRAIFVAENLEGRVLLSVAAATAASSVHLDSGLAYMLSHGEDSVSPRKPNKSVAVSPAPKVATPRLKNTFEGINFRTNTSMNGFAAVPPDPTVATGPTNIVTAVNSSVVWYDKAGGLQYSKTIGNFFSPLKANSISISDPRLIYDANSGFFALTAIEQDQSTQTSRLLIAISRDTNPNDGWRYYSINAAISINGNLTWADFPQIAGDGHGLYITANQFTFANSTFGGSRLWILDQYTGDYRMFDPSTEANMPAQAFTLFPAQVLGAPPPDGGGTYLVSSGWIRGNYTNLLSVIHIADPFGTPMFTNQFPTLGAITQAYWVPTAYQSRSPSPIDAGDGRIVSAVWRNNMLYAANTINPTRGADANQPTAHWYKMIASESYTKLVQQGNISGSALAPGASTFYPAVTVDRKGNMAIGFAASGQTISPGAYYTTHSLTDAPSAVSAYRTLAAGQGIYVRTFGQPINRWGDFSGIALDPMDNATFWLFNEYAQRSGAVTNGETGLWGTRIGSFSLL